ncbi:MAG TPA: hypothetical protein VI386_35395 [Candidatus Sulfotelmatobacter sp.]
MNDANGNSLTDPSGKSYTWNFDNRMVSGVVPGASIVTFKYDPFGRRIQKNSSAGLTNYRARYYDLLSGHFLSVDPLQFRTSDNFYGRVL